MFAGRFCEQKGVLDALRAVHALRAEGRNVELRLIGDDTMTDGSYAAEMHAYIRENALGDSVTRLGFVNLATTASRSCSAATCSSIRASSTGRAAAKAERRRRSSRRRRSACPSSRRTTATSRT